MPRSGISVNAPNVALIFEGGGMRAAYTSAVVVALIEAGIVFDWVGGISAGSSNLANYVSSDAWRARASFTEATTDPQFGGWRTFVRGQGLFNSDYIYRRMSGPDDPLPFNFDAFMRHPAEVSIQALRCRDGELVGWGKDDIQTMDDLMARVQASSTMPVLMPPVTIDGEVYVDGALGPTGGIALDAARAAGYRKFFVVLTQERSYQKKPLDAPWFYRQYFRRYPAVADALITRWLRYNQTREELFDLESSGDAYLFVPSSMKISNGERSLPKLTQTHALGKAQANRELPAWREFLGLN